MSSRQLIEKRLVFIVDCVAEIRQLADLRKLREDLVQQRFAEHTLQIAVQAMLDVAFAVASEHNLGEPGDHRQVFERLCAHGWITTAMRDTCRRMVAFRNVVVHRYLQVDVEILIRIVQRDLDDLLAFVRTIRDRLDAE